LTGDRSEDLGNGVSEIVAQKKPMKMVMGRGQSNVGSKVEDIENRKKAGNGQKKSTRRTT